MAPTNPLAGGNFYWVAQGGGSAANDVFGHNVFGISVPDNNITPAEGAPGINFSGCANSCHRSLALDPNLNFLKQTGCQGCHTEVAHHDDTKPWFRFLKGHMSDGAYVSGLEAPDWEQNAITSSADRNVYLGTDATYFWGSGLNDQHTASAFCQGCHTDFHEDMGVSSPWIRHPTDILLPDDVATEYAAYDPAINYSNEAPVAYLAPAAPHRGETVVTCLSCHRAHGSDQPDMLRWDYVNMPAGTGCYTCHTEKDD
ncbi:MAG: cytochrome c3 family protein [Thermodesulfobacteriota bacterium]